MELYSIDTDGKRHGILSPITWAGLILAACCALAVGICAVALLTGQLWQRCKGKILGWMR